MSTRIIAVANQKGGVGKTTTVASLGAALTALGRRVLLVDIDPQANLTSAVGSSKDLPGSYELLLGEATATSVIVGVLDAAGKQVPDGARLDLIPSSPDLAGVETELVGQANRVERLRNGLLGSIETYDYVLIDCPPALGLLTLNALVAAASVLAPIQCEYLALEGLTQLLDTLRRVRDRLNPELRGLFLLMTMFDSRTGLGQHVVEEVRTHFPDLFLQTMIPRTIRLGEAPSYGQSIMRYDPSGRGAEAYRSLAAELDARFDAARPATLVGV